MTDRAVDDPWIGPYRYPEGSLGFTRVVSLSDAIFAIAMTLLVLTLEVPTGAVDDLATMLLELGPQLVAFVLSFGFVANIWWEHQKVVDSLQEFEPGLIGLNLVLLGAVALVPFPTSLVGSFPSDRAAVWSLIAMFMILSLIYLVIVVRAQRVDAWGDPMPTAVWYWNVLTWGMGMLVLVIAAVVAVWSPIIALLLLAVSVVFGPIAARFSYRPLEDRTD